LWLTIEIEMDAGTAARAMVSIMDVAHHRVLPGLCAGTGAAY
jgi:hypothetical protein